MSESKTENGRMTLKDLLELSRLGYQTNFQMAEALAVRTKPPKGKRQEK